MIVNQKFPEISSPAAQVLIVSVALNDHARILTTLLAGRGLMLCTAEMSPLYQIMHLYKKIKCKINKLWVFQNS
jgi:hypothetical protein